MDKICIVICGIDRYFMNYIKIILNRYNRYFKMYDIICTMDVSTPYPSIVWCTHKLPIQIQVLWDQLHLDRYCNLSVT